MIGLLAGCGQGSGYADIDRFMAETRAKPRGHIEPLPEFMAYEAFTYSASDRRSPFDPPIDVQLANSPTPESDVKPDFDRPKDVLEDFSLNQLSMVGTLSGASGGMFALVADAEGGIHRVRNGNYLGQNHGRIVGVSENRIEIMEIVPNGSGGWVERPRTLSLVEG